MVSRSQNLRALRGKSAEELKKILATEIDLFSISDKIPKSRRNNVAQPPEATQKAPFPKNAALTLISQQLKAEQRIKYAKAKRIPKDLRPKRTHALRLRLTKYEKTKKTLRQRKREIHFPQRVYAVCAR